MPGSAKWHSRRVPLGHHHGEGVGEAGRGPVAARHHHRVDSSGNSARRERGAELGGQVQLRLVGLICRPVTRHQADGRRGVEPRPGQGQHGVLEVGAEYLDVVDEGKQ